MPDPVTVDNPAPDAGPTGGEAPVTLINDNTPAEVSAPQNWPDDWRQLMAGDDEKAMTQAERFNSPVDVWKSMREGQNKISQHKPALARPGEDSTPEDVAAYRAANDVPEKFEDYNLDFGDGTVLGDDIKEQLNGFFEHAHDRHLSNDMVKDTVQWYMKDVEVQKEAIGLANDEARINGIADLKSEWGGEYQGNINAMSSLFVNAPEGVQNALLHAQDSNGLKFANNPDNIRWLVGLAKELNPTATLVPPGPDQAASIDTEIEKIQGWMSSADKSEKAKYWGDQSVQDRLMKLLSAKESMK